MTISTGSEIVLRPTVLGVGGKIAKWFGGEADERIVKVDGWMPGESASLSWSITTQVETAQSLASRKAYDEAYASSPVGVEIPKPPEPTYEDVVKSGTIKTASLASATALELPERWPQGDGGTVETSLLWLSRVQYDELASTRSTTLSLGLFDESLVQVEEVTSKLESFMSRISKILPLPKGELEGVASDSESSTNTPVPLSLLTITASPSWGQFSIMVDDVRTMVQTIEAKNKFGSLTILANRDNPLVLELRLTPLAQGSLDVLSAEGFRKGFGGYEVAEIKNPEIK